MSGIPYDDSRRDAVLDRAMAVYERLYRAWPRRRPARKTIPDQAGAR